MPALPDVAKVLRVDHKFVLADDTDVLNRQYIQYTGSAPTGTELDTFANGVYSAYDTTVMPSMTSELEHESCTVTDLSTITSPRGSFSGSTTGTSGSSYLTAGAAIVWQFKIPVRYRGGHPRNYLAGIPIEAMDTAQDLDAGYAASLISQLRAYIAATLLLGWSGAGTLLHVYVSYYSGYTNVTYPSGRIKPVPTVRATPVVLGVNAYALNMKIGSQRRRNQTNS